MKFKYVTLFLLAIATILFSCKKTEEVPVPAPLLSINAANVTVAVNTKYPFTSSANGEINYTHEWLLDGKTVSTSNFYVFNPTTAGNYTLMYKASNTTGVFTHTYKIEVPIPVVGATPTSSKYISRIFEYLPAPGQFINEAAVGSLAQAQKLIGNTNNLLTLGAYGGYLIFGFDHSVVNQNGNDLAIYGNPIGGTTPWAEPGIVMVSQDKNGNGLPDDEWYELAGSEYNDPATIKNYEITYTNPKGYANVTWKDNKGNSGAVETNTFHKHNYYPEFAPDQETLTFKGTLLRPSFGKVGSIFVNEAFSWGYTDSWSLGDDYQTNRYNGFDISWAVDKNGKKVDLKTIDFVKVYTAQNDKGNALLGEISTEIKGASDLNIK
ncbi:PKD domain-containing protein [Pedobacter sp. UC225_65]|uniref:PKD domain-containing protein n=1 Tax=Pedobacter sp. UC225_65 TaxID=3350173 RepID=UPI00367317B6